MDRLTNFSIDLLVESYFKNKIYWSYYNKHYRYEL